MSGGGRFGVQGDMQLTSASSELIPESAILRPRGILTFLQGLMTAQARAWRVLTLLVAVAAMSLGDLIMTLTYAQSIGMVELNPLARFLMQSSSPVYIILYKLGSVMIACLILFVARKTRVRCLRTPNRVFCPAGRRDPAPASGARVAAGEPRDEITREPQGTRRSAVHGSERLEVLREDARERSQVVAGPVPSHEGLPYPDASPEDHRAIGGRVLDRDRRRERPGVPEDEAFVALDDGDHAEREPPEERVRAPPTEVVHDRPRKSLELP